MKRLRKGPSGPVVSETAPGEGQGSGSVEIANKAKQGRRRGNPSWVKGGPSPNPEGRPGGYVEFREMCRSKSPKAVQALEEALANGDASAVAAARVLLEYGWGKPASAPEDLDAVREGGGSALAMLSRDELLAIAKLSPETD